MDRIWSGVPRGARLLFANDPGLQGEPFLHQSARHHLESGSDVVFAVTDRPPSSLLRALREQGIDLERHGDRLHILDAYSPLLGTRDENAWPVADPRDPASWSLALSELVDRHPDAVLLVDSFSTLADQIGFAPFLDVAERLAPLFARFRFSAFLFTRWPYGDDLHALYGLHDGVVTLQAVQERVVISQYFAVERAEWQTDIDHQPHLYKVMDDEGIVVYIPKIVVTGPFNAGKSTFIRNISESAVSVDRMGTTVALDHGTVFVDGLRAEVFGTPGQSRFDPVLRIIAGQALGVVLIVDATRPESFPRAQAMMDQVWRQGIPVIIAANKQDQAGALEPEEVAALLQTPSIVQVIGCRAEDPASSKRVIMRLIAAIMDPPAGDPSLGPAIIGGGMS